MASEAWSTSVAAREQSVNQTSRHATAQAASDASVAELADLYAQSQRLVTVFERGAIRCGVHPDRPGFSVADENGAYTGFFVNLCRAMATAVVGGPRAVQFVEIDPGDEAEALVEGDIDILAASFDWTLQQETQSGNGTLPIYYGGYTFLVPSASGFSTATDLSGNTVCAVEGSPEERVFLDWKRTDRVAVDSMRFPNAADALSAYQLGFCTAIIGDLPTLATTKLQMESPSDHRALDDIFSEVQAVLAVPNGSDEWFNVVKFVMAGIIHAENLGVTSENVEASQSNQSISIRRLAGYEGDFGQQALYLGPRVLQRVVATVGNYGEIYDRHFGRDALNIKRGEKRLWNDGGSIYAPPLR